MFTRAEACASSLASNRKGALYCSAGPRHSPISRWSNFGKTSFARCSGLLANTVWNVQPAQAGFAVCGLSILMFQAAILAREAH